jgi:hypothetical protein
VEYFFILPDIDEGINNHQEAKQGEINVRQNQTELKRQEADSIDDK